MLAGTNQDCRAADHDFSAYNICPTVRIFVDTPSGQSAVSPSMWYEGQVFIGVKDACLQASNPWRHAAETLKALRQLDRTDLRVRLLQDVYHAFIVYMG